MNTVDLATWGQIISSAAVLITLVYLSVQTRQTAKLLNSESRQSIIDVDLQLLGLQVQIPELSIDFATETELTVERKYQLWAYLCAFMRTREHHWLQLQYGVLDEAAWNAYQSAIPVVIGSPRGRAWWKLFGPPLYDPAFVKIVDEILDRMPISQLEQQMNEWH